MNKYELWYQSLIERAKNRAWTKKTAPCYVEAHHIIPKSLGGTNDDHNIVTLTAREHCIAHLLLIRFGTAEQKIKMHYAISRFAYCNKDKIHSKLYVKAKTELQEIRKQRMMGNKHLLNHKHSDVTKKKMSDKRIGVPKSENFKNMISQLVKEKLANKPEITCPHCGLTSKNHSNMTRWHNDNCKERL